MKRLIAALLVVSMAAQVSACSSLPTASAGSVSSGPVVTGPARVSTRNVDATTVVVAEPAVPATEFWGGPMAIALGVVVIGAMAVAIRSADSGARTAGAGGPAAP